MGQRNCCTKRPGTEILQLFDCWTYFVNENKKSDSQTVGVVVVVGPAKIKSALSSRQRWLLCWRRLCGHVIDDLPSDNDFCNICVRLSAARGFGIRVLCVCEFIFAHLNDDVNDDDNNNESRCRLCWVCSWPMTTVFNARTLRSCAKRIAFADWNDHSKDQFPEWPLMSLLLLLVLMHGQTELVSMDRQSTMLQVKA